MMPLLRLIVILLMSSQLPLFSLGTLSAADRPNFVLVMCDDLGWGDVGFNGGKHIRTPHLDEMAGNGLTLRRFYAQAPVCSPTRASFVTGRHHDRTGIYTANFGHLRGGEFSLYEAVAAKGYTTGHFGKWHMGTLTRETQESNRGVEGKKHYSPPWNHQVDTNFASEAKMPTFDPMWKPAASGKSDRFDVASKFGWNQIPEGRDRVLYGTHYWVGEETMVDPKSDELLGDDSRLIMDRAIRFIDGSGEKPFLAVVWFHAPHLPVVASQEDAARYEDGNTTAFQRNYYGCVSALDRQVGRLRAHLRSKGIADNTVVTFCSDNGPEGKSGAPGQTGGFRGRKRSLYEGGVRVPGVIEWPAKIKRAVSSDIATCTVDYYPTVLDILNVEMPDGRPVDGVSLLPLIEGTMDERPRPLAFHYRGAAAWHDGSLKAIRPGKQGDWQLFDLAADPSESNDVARENTAKLDAMVADWTRWKKSVDASDSGADY